MSATSPTPKIHPEAYSAVATALATLWWYKKTFQNNMKMLLGHHPELLANLDFAATKQSVADDVVTRLACGEWRYRTTTLALMRTLAGFAQLAELRQQPEGAALVAKAEAAIRDVRTWADHYRCTYADESAPAEQSPAAGQRVVKHLQLGTGAAGKRLAELRDDFLNWEKAKNRQNAGRALEALLNSLFHLYDLEPRLAYRVFDRGGLEVEQIDGSILCDSTHFIVEIKWWKAAVGRRELDVFAKQIERKGMNAQGLYLAIGGFTAPALETYRTGTPFIAMDGVDLLAVLDGRIGLVDLLRAKKRYAADFGSCFRSCSDILAE